MDQKTSLWDYLSQTFMIYGITIALLNGFVLLFGENAAGFSTIFGLGGSGLQVKTMLQFLLVCAAINILRFLFMTDRLIHHLPLTARIIAMFASVLALTVGCIVLFGWFPVGNLTAWLMFIVCFTVSCTVSTVISGIKEKQDNKRLAAALDQFKENL